MYTKALIIIVVLSWAFILYIASIVQKLRKEVKHQKQLVYVLRLSDKQDSSIPKHTVPTPEEKTSDQSGLNLRILKPIGNLLRYNISEGSYFMFHRIKIIKTQMNVKLEGLGKIHEIKIIAVGNQIHHVLGKLPKITGFLHLHTIKCKLTKKDEIEILEHIDHRGTNPVVKSAAVNNEQLNKISSNPICELPDCHTCKVYGSASQYCMDCVDYKNYIKE